MPLGCLVPGDFRRISSVYVQTCLTAYLPVHHPVCLTGSVDSLQRYVKNAKLDKDQHSGHTESHKDVQCLRWGDGGGRRGRRGG